MQRVTSKLTCVAAVVVLVLLGASCGTSSDSGSGPTTSVGDATHADHEAPPATASLPPCPDEAAIDPHAMGHDGDDSEDRTSGPARDCRLPTAVQAELDPQLAVTRAILEQYPDQDAALTGGYEVSEGNSHLVNWEYMDDEFDLRHPEMLLLDDEGDTGEVLAAVYYVVTDDAAPPEGFIGTRDLWHPHASICVAAAKTSNGTQVRCDGDDQGAGCEVVLLRSGSKGECGPPTLVGGADGWMLHVWEMPGHPNALGLFSAD